MARPAPKVTVNPEQERALQRLVARRTTAQSLAMRARIVLACAEGGQNEVVPENRTGS